MQGMDGHGHGHGSVPTFYEREIRTHAAHARFWMRRSSDQSGDDAAYRHAVWAAHYANASVREQEAS